MYYKVKARCGHVGRNNYIEKFFYVVAKSGKIAAHIVRYIPRVKHNRKDAILSVEKVSEEEYKIGLEDYNADPYFHVYNSSEQRLIAAVDPNDIKEEPQRVRYDKKKNSIYLTKILKIIDKQCREMLSEVYYG